MDASLAAVVFGTVNLALLGLLFLAWRRDKGSPSWRLKTALRLQEHDQRLNGLNGLLKEQDELRRVLRAELSGRVDSSAGEVCALKEKVEKLEKTVEVLVGTFSSTGEIVDGHTDRIAAVELKQKTERDRRLGWEEGFSEGIKIQLRHLEKRVEGLERIKPIFIREADRQSDGTPAVPFYHPPVQLPRTSPCPDPLAPPFKLTCHAKGQEPEVGR